MAAEGNDKPGAMVIDDQIDALLVRISPGGQTARLASVTTTLQARPEQVAAGRRFVRDALAAWDQEELADDACLLASEILTNAMRHARHAICLRLHRMPGEILAEVTDDYALLPQRTPPALSDEFGRGLALVEALAHRWGTLPTSTGKIVWFTLAIGGRPVPGRGAGGLARRGKPGPGNRRPTAGQMGDASSGTEHARRCCLLCRSP